LLASFIFREPGLNIYCAIINFSLLIIAAGVTTRNAVRSKQAIRLFWSFLAAAYWVWALPPCVWFYYRVLHGTVPSFLLMTFPWFLHIVLMIAAMAARPHLRPRIQKPYSVTLCFLMVLFLLVFSYAYLLFPYGWVPEFPVAMRRFAAIYSAENLILLIVLVALVAGSQPPWKKLYLHLFGASVLYAIQSQFAHLVFASNSRFTDGLVAVPFSAAAAWFVWISAKGRKQTPELARTVQLDTSDRRRTSLLAMVAVVAIPVVGLFELLRTNEPQSVRSIRLLIVLISVVLLAVVAFIQDYLSNRQLASDITLANDQLRLAVESGKSVVWDWDLRSKPDFWFGDLHSMFGVQSGTFSGLIADFRRYVHPDDREHLSKRIAEAIKTQRPFEGEFRVVLPDGVIRDATAMGKCYYGPHGQAERMLGITMDITDRKQAERELRELSGHLIAAQEEERARIARELHDDLSQRLALLAVELQTLNSFATEVAAAKSLDGLVQRIREISEDVHSLSHRLHPALLDRVGLVPALRKLCKELQAQSGITLTFTCGDVPASLSKNVSVGLFRVAQEALANVVKHSGTAAASIELTTSRSYIRLRVMDYGHGFEQNSNHRHGLGLLSMRERIRLIGGELSVRSQPSKGTVVQAEIPLPGANSSVNSLKTTA
jgi:PAS domain S-box-containing protein